MNRAWYARPIAEFCAAPREWILGEMVERNDFPLEPAQRDAWLEQTDLLQRVLASYTGSVYLEFTIPRMGSRVDAVVIIGPVIFVLEFKVGETRFYAADVDQVVDYALDLHNFHEGSHRVAVAPVLISTGARDSRTSVATELPADGLLPASKTNAAGLKQTIDSILALVRQDDIPVADWERSGYKPTPTIIEATLALCRGHAVTEISRSDAGATNLSRTSGTVADIIATARQRAEKAVCFVTGVPGADKTLVGLDAATKHIDRTDELYSVFLSGNGPLVRVLQEALARDKVERYRRRGSKIRKGQALSEVKAFIQNVHHFRDDCLADPDRPPVEHVAIFDEA